MNRMFSGLVTVVMMTVLSGCVTTPRPTVTPLVITDSKLEYVTGSFRPGAVQVLARAGRDEWLAGKYDSSLQVLNRALRISPDDGLLYYYMARVYRDMGDSRQAGQLARRGLSLSVNEALQQALLEFLTSLTVVDPELS